MSPTLLDAIQVAAKAHDGQRRKHLDDPYLLHLLRVAKMAADLGFDEEVQQAGVLHDVVEDTSLTLEDLATLGFSVKTRDLVRLLTKWWGDHDDTPAMAADKAQYYRLIATDRDAVALKLFDRADNLRDFAKVVDAPDCKKSTRAWGQRYVAKTEAEFTDLLSLATQAGGKYLAAATVQAKALIDLKARFSATVTA
jgi:(p)ppGpp synthase/HD superfamily hydrolase